MWPSRDTCPGVVYGSVTAVTCGACSNGTSALATCARTAGAVTGCAELIASVSESPDCRAKCWLSSVCPGSAPLNELSAAAPNRIHSVISTATPTTHASSVVFRCR